MTFLAESSAADFARMTDCFLLLEIQRTRVSQAGIMSSLTQTFSCPRFAVLDMSPWSNNRAGYADGYIGINRVFVPDNSASDCDGRSSSQIPSSL